MKELNEEEIKEVHNTKINYDDSSMFLHCQHCMKEFVGSKEHKEKSPQDAMNYELSAVPFTYPDGTTANIMVAWCKRCRRKVWDSRHLQPYI